MSLLLIGLATGLPVAYRRSTGNFGTVEPGRFYRSAQLDADGLRRVIREHTVKTVLNLRGPNPEQAWYRDEVAAATGAGATLIDLPMASDQWLSREQARTLLEVLDHCETPVLIHCEFGAERTGLVSAIIELLEPGRTIEEARSQFSIRYLFLPIKDGLVMRGHLDRYEAWLRERGVAHEPERFREWLVGTYRPGMPSREYWPCNPYPRKVVTARGQDGQTRTVPELPANACPKTIATQIEQRKAARR